MEPQKYESKPSQKINFHFTFAAHSATVCQRGANKPRAPSPALSPVRSDGVWGMAGNGV